MIMLVEIVQEDRGWKGTCGRIGEKYLVWKRESPPPVVPGSYREFGFSAMSFRREDFKQIPMGWLGWRLFFQNLGPAIRSARFSRAVRRSLRRAGLSG